MRQVTVSWSACARCLHHMCISFAVPFSEKDDRAIGSQDSNDKGDSNARS